MNSSEHTLSLTYNYDELDNLQQGWPFCPSADMWLELYPFQLYIVLLIVVVIRSNEICCDQGHWPS